ncbi:MAG: hypothetical protein JWN04_3224 [Myxococcaceae bacterium]|nr:hypothetical protein [Myxococcaceae bacterium]
MVAILSLVVSVARGHAQDGPLPAEPQSSGRALRELAVEAFELRHCEQAVSLLRRALAAQAQPLEGELRAEAAALLLRAEVVLCPTALTLDRIAAAPGVEERPVHERSAASPAPLAPAAPSPTAMHGAPRNHGWLLASAVVLTCAAALALGFGLTAHSTDLRAAISAVPVATRGGP